jgi:hypothetical protein
VVQLELHGILESSSLQLDLYLWEQEDFGEVSVLYGPAPCTEKVCFVSVRHQ